LSPHQLLLSFRRPEIRDSSRAFQLKHQLAFDWPWEWGPCPWGPPQILSYHHRDATQTGLSGTLSAIPTTSSPSVLGSIFKLALPIHSFSELLEGHRWQQADPQRRSFLPMSEGGRWRWYRLLMKNRSPIQFLREGAGSAPDQPTLLEWLRLSELQPSSQNFDQSSSPGRPLQFAAVLGAPVEHSRTPAVHFEFFKSRGAPVFAIQVSREDWQEGALNALREFGLRWAAITSPLKDLAFQKLQSPSPFVRDLGAVNTLAWNNSLSQWVGTNTDSAGLAQALACHIPNYRNLHFAIWGGGGTLEIAKQVLPQTSTSYSSRTGQARTPNTFLESPDVILWSVGRKNFDLNPRFPPSEWKPKFILDMNYTEDSPGLEYALKTKIHYFNGLEMFKGQAFSQQEFWKALDPHEQYDE
jgi:shikimate 5-dehydrogenase